MPRSKEIQILRRRQRVILNGKASKWHQVTASIIQGSCLGPTLAKTFSNSSHQDRNLTPENKPLVSKFADDEKEQELLTMKSKARGHKPHGDLDPEDGS